MYYCLYYKDSRQSDLLDSPEDILSPIYRLEIWKPGFFRPLPRGLSLKVVFFWSLAHLTKFFSKLSFAIFTVYYQDIPVHSTFVSCKSFKFPFMGNNDLQIGPCDTVKAHRRKGIASYVINRILNDYEEEGRRFWWIVREENQFSRNFIEGMGFVFSKKAVKKSRVGTGCYYAMEN